MESIINFACTNAHYAPWVIFALLLLSGIGVPVSEDSMLIIGGVIASICIPEHTLFLFAWIFAGSVLSAWETYWIGRYFGPKLYDIRWFRWIVTPQRIKMLHHYYEKFGVFTFIVGRFCPGGIRNGLFITAGLGKMPFAKFILRDTFAACISVSTIFCIGFYFGSNYETIMHYLHAYTHVALGLLIIVAIGGSLYAWHQSKSPEDF